MLQDKQQVDLLYFGTYARWVAADMPNDHPYHGLASAYRIRYGDNAEWHAWVRAADWDDTRRYGG